MSNARHRAGRGAPSDALNPERHAITIAADVDAAWHRFGAGTGRIEVPLGVVATIAIAGLMARAPSELEAALRAASAEEFVAAARHVWARTLRARPDLVHVLCPLISWLFTTPDTATANRAKAVADAALDARLLNLTATDRRFDADVLGPLLGTLKSRTAAWAHAQIYTPGDLATALAGVVIDDPQPGQSIGDDAVGTGGLFRAAAQIVRAHGVEPSAMVWYGADIDELAIAATAVNSLIWGLGDAVILFVGDILANANWPEQAHQRRAAAVRTFTDLSAVAEALGLAAEYCARLESP